jgi:hypothetical protein
MSANDLDTVVGTYLERLDLALSAMPAPKRDQLEEEIAQHVAEGRRQLGEESPAALLQLLDRIGRPEDIAAAAFEEDEDRRLSFQGSGPGNRGLPDRFAIGLLLFGGFLFGIGWLVGAILLWASSAWRVRDKLLGTLVFPGGLALPLYFLAAPSGWLIPAWAGVVILAVLLIAPVLVAVHLHRSRRVSGQEEG